MRSESALYRAPGDRQASTDFRRASPLVFVALMWFVSGIGSTMPFANNTSIKLLLLVPPFAISLLLTLLNPKDGLALWSVSLAFLVTQTGYQLALGDVILSALEVVLVFLVLFLIWHDRRSSITGESSFRLPGHKYLALFVIYALIMFAISMIRSVPLSSAIIEFKGFVLYPFMAYVMVAGLKSVKVLRWSTGVVLGWYIYTAARGIRQFLQSGLSSDYVFRASGDYAPINTYGITLLAVSLFALGLAMYTKDRRFKMLLLLITFWLFVGAVTSVARTIWVAGAGAVLVLLMSRDKKRYAISIFIIATIVFLLLPNQVSGRLDQLSDSSTVKREFYLESGIQAWKARWLTGWGWGSAFWYYQGIGLVPTSDGIAWYHNDYLNLAEQTGLLGLALYVGYWWKVLRSVNGWSRKQHESPLIGYVLGGQMALVALLVSAGFEHVLWKSDIAGLVGWISGVLFACMYLDSKERSEIEAA